MNFDETEIGGLFDDLVKDGREIIRKGDYELVSGDGISVQTDGNRYVDIVWVSRHSTIKDLVHILVESNVGIKDVTVTTDHVCMRLNRNHFLENIDAKNLLIHDTVKIYDSVHDEEIYGRILDVVNIGQTCEYVYDLEVDDDSHTFYANDILVHNSQFVNIQCITDWMKREYNLPDRIMSWTDDDKLKLWKFMDDFVENDLNKFVQNLVKDYYHTEHPEVLRYSLEYIGDTEIMESKKHYGVHKILSEGPEIVDKIKYSGIELKKANIPVAVKKFLGDIYAGVLTKDWKLSDFKSYMNHAYDEFCKLSVQDIAMWKGYNTGRKSSGFLQMATQDEDGNRVVATGISKACTYYNQIIEKLGIGKKYDSILVGDKARFLYVKPTNRFGINVLAFKDGQYPKEFDGVFEVDKDVMWDKLILSTLKRFLIATKFKDADPRKQNIMDIDDL